MPVRRPRLVVVAERGLLVEPTVTGALADLGGTGGRALLLIEATTPARNMLKFELLMIVFGILRNQRELGKPHCTSYSMCPLLFVD